MKKDNTLLPVSIGTEYLLIYLFVINYNPRSIATIILFLFSTVVIAWMTLFILKHGKPSHRSFEKYFNDEEKWLRD